MVVLVHGDSFIPLYIIKYLQCAKMEGEGLMGSPVMHLCIKIQFLKLRNSQILISKFHAFVDVIEKNKQTQKLLTTM